MSKRVTMQDIADKLNITKVSVSKALNNQSGISDALREKILQTAEQLGYSSHMRKATEKSYVFGFIVTKRFFLETDRFYSVIYYHLSKLCLNQGHKLILIVLSEQEEKDGMLPEMLCKDKLDGVFIVGQPNQSYLLALKKSPLPKIALDFYKYGLDMDFVIADNFYLGYWATMLMIEKGHKKIGFVGNRVSTSSISDRYFGYLKAMSINGFDVKDEWLLVNNDSDTGCYTTEITLPSDMPTGFICHCEMAAYFLKLTLDKNGISIPEDVSVIAFDNTEISRTTMKNLSTFDIDKWEIASCALKLMLKRIKDPSGAFERQYVHSNLIERGSIFNLK